VLTLRNQNEHFESIAYWWEARDVFIHLFVDGATIPVARRAPLHMVEKITRLLSRLVRFLWACERPLINQNLLLLDLYTLHSIDLDRAVRSTQRRGRIVAWQLQLSARMKEKAKKSRPSAENGPRSPAAVGRTAKTLSDDTSLQFDEMRNDEYTPQVLDGLFYFCEPKRRDSLQRRAAESQKGTFTRGLSGVYLVTHMLLLP
jgi:hypothetical protein